MCSSALGSVTHTFPSHEFASFANSDGPIFTTCLALVVLESAFFEFNLEACQILLCVFEARFRNSSK